MKRALCAVLLVALIVFPGLGLTEGDDTIQLARTLYTLGRDESFETKLMIGSVIMNRVGSPWFPDSVREVIGQPHQFPHGTRYDEESLQAAREIMMGRRTLPGDVVYYGLLNSQNNHFSKNTLFITSGEYGFFTMN